LRISGRWSWFGMARPIIFEMKNIGDKLWRAINDRKI